MLGQVIPPIRTALLRAGVLLWVGTALTTLLSPATGTAAPDSKSVEPPVSTASQGIDYIQLRRKITTGGASLADVRQALTQTDPAGLTNNLHALYSMRWHRGVNNLLHAMWEGEKAKYPGLNWEDIGKAPARIALASTLGRIEYTDNKGYLAYIRSHKDDEHEFHRAQVVVALGMNGDPDDVGYIKSMADGDNHYVAQTAITGLSLMNNKHASDAMIELWRKHKHTNRGDLLLELLRQAYNLVPTTEPPPAAAGPP